MGALTHPGAALLDVVSPCVAFNNHSGSTKSYDYVREHNEALNRLDFITGKAPIEARYAPGETQEVSLHDGSRLRLVKLDADYDPTDRVAAQRHLLARQRSGEVVTGLLFLDPEPEDLHRHLNTVATPLFALGEDELCPGVETLARINARLR